MQTEPVSVRLPNTAIRDVQEAMAQGHKRSKILRMAILCGLPQVLELMKTHPKETRNDR